jgi:hypothetical protein
MRFTLQHVLAFHVAWLLLAGVNVLLSGRFSLCDALVIPLVCGAGGVVGLLRFNSLQGRSTPCPPLRPFLVGMLKAVALSVFSGLLFGAHQAQVCTRTSEVEQDWYLGALRLRISESTAAAEIIRTDLRYVPAEKHWMATSTGLWFTHGDQFPRYRYPILQWSDDDLRLLAYLQPVEKCQVLFQCESAIDLRMSDLRSRLHNELLYRLGKLGGKRRAGTDAEIVNEWWREFEPVLRPSSTPEDLARAKADFAATGPHAQYWELAVPSLR